MPAKYFTRAEQMTAREARKAQERALNVAYTAYVASVEAERAIAERIPSQLGQDLRDLQALLAEQAAESRKLWKAYQMLDRQHG